MLCNFVHAFSVVYVYVYATGVCLGMSVFMCVWSGCLVCVCWYRGWIWRVVCCLSVFVRRFVGPCLMVYMYEDLFLGVNGGGKWIFVGTCYV